MSNITPSKPSFVFGYWRPWKEDSNLFDSYMDYARDSSLAKYGADTVGKYINQASQQQVEAINNLGQAVGRGMNVLSNQMNVLSSQMSDINSELSFLNRNMDIQIEQQKLSNLLLQNIAELLRVPDSEKERQRSIELGIKFFVNAKKDTDLYADALEELLKAESLMKQDYFVLHRLGYIYLYVEKYINPEKAFDYFIRAGKYASVESDKGAVKLANALTKNFNTSNSAITNSEEQIGILASDSYEKAAFAAYVLGRFEDAVNNQSKVVKFNSTPKNRFTLAKYQVRNGKIDEAVDNLNRCIDEEPVLAIAAFREIDLINEPSVINLVNEKNNLIDDQIRELLNNYKQVHSNSSEKVVIALNDLLNKPYNHKVTGLKDFVLNGEMTITLKEQFIKKIDKQISAIKLTTFATYNRAKVEQLTNELIKLRDLPQDKLENTFSKLQYEIAKDKLTIGSSYGGGKVFYLDNTGNHGLICSEKDFGKAVWGRGGLVNALANEISGGRGLQNSNAITMFMSEMAKQDGNMNNFNFRCAASICINTNSFGHKDWYLPTLAELKLIYKNLFLRKKTNFHSENYWSSTESNNFLAKSFSFRLGHEETTAKSLKLGVLAVRAF